MKRDLDAIYVTASASDARYTRICVASIRFFYPKAPIRLLVGGQLERGLEEELARYWAVKPADVPRGNWGWGFVKLEPLFGKDGERFLVLDSDTVFAGPVLETWAAGSADFMVDDEEQSEADTHRLYYNWRKVAAIDPEARPPKFVFNSGQWFGTAGALTRDDFLTLLNWSGMPPKLCHPGLFMPGDQGVLNYVLNQKVALNGFAVDRRQIMRWPGHGLKGITAESVANRTAPPLVIHWAGMKNSRLSKMAGTDVLQFFEKFYYSRLPNGEVRRLIATVRYGLKGWTQEILVKARQRIKVISFA